MPQLLFDKHYTFYSLIYLSLKMIKAHTHNTLISNVMVVWHIYELKMKNFTNIKYKSSKFKKLNAGTKPKQTAIKKSATKTKLDGRTLVISTMIIHTVVAGNCINVYCNYIPFHTIDMLLLFFFYFATHHL